MKKQTPKQEPTDNRHAKKMVTVNRRARHEYFIDETYDAGLSLAGTEVKSIRNGKVNIQDAFCRVEHGEVWLYNMHVAPYEQGTRWNTDPLRRRKLLLHRKEIDVVRAQMEQKGLALIPLSLYFQHGFAKIQIGLARGKKLYDKRDDIAKRDTEREARRELAGRD